MVNNNHSFIEKNIACLMSYHPSFSRQIDATSCFTTSLTTGTSKTYLPIAYALHNNIQIPLVSQYDPIKAANKAACISYNKTCHHFLILGLGLGYLPRALLSLCSGDQSIHVIIPDRNLFLSQCTVADFTALFTNERIRFISGIHIGKLIASLRLLSAPYTLDDMQLVFTNSYKAIMADYCNQVNTLFLKERKYVIDEHETFIRDTRINTAIDTMQPCNQEQYTNLFHTLAYQQTKSEDIDPIAISYLFFINLLFVAYEKNAAI